MNGPSPPRRRWLGHPALSVIIAVVWLLLQGSLAPAALLWAAILGLVLPWLVAPFLGTATRPRAPHRMLQLALRVPWDILLANFSVARIVLNPRRAPRPAWVHVPYTLQDPHAIALLVTIVTITPGTMSLFIDEERREILLHALDAPDPQAVVDTILRRYEHPLKEIFG